MFRNFSPWLILACCKKENGLDPSLKQSSCRSALEKMYQPQDGIYLTACQVLLVCPYYFVPVLLWLIFCPVEVATCNLWNETLKIYWANLSLGEMSSFISFVGKINLQFITLYCQWILGKVSPEFFSLWFRSLFSQRNVVP